MAEQTPCGRQVYRSASGVYWAREQCLLNSVYSNLQSEQWSLTPQEVMRHVNVWHGKGLLWKELETLELRISLHIVHSAYCSPLIASRNEIRPPLQNVRRIVLKVGFSHRVFLAFWIFTIKRSTKKIKYFAIQTSWGFQRNLACLQCAMLSGCEATVEEAPRRASSGRWLQCEVHTVNCLAEWTPLRSACSSGSCLFGDDSNHQEFLMVQKILRGQNHRELVYMLLSIRTGITS